MVDELAGDGEFFGQFGQMVFVIPAASSQFAALQFDFSAHIFGCETYHQTAGVGPGLAGEVTNVLNGDAHLLAYFAHHGFFERLARFNETSHQSEEIALEVVGMNQQHLVAPVDEHDDGCGKLGPNLLTAK